MSRVARNPRAAAPADWQHVREYLSSQEIRRWAGYSANRGSVEPTSLRLTDLGNEVGDSGEAVAIQRESVDGVLNSLAPTDDPHMLGRLGPYEIAGVVGRGGMGVVLKALDPALNRFVAIKVLAPQLATSGAARQRFAREARAAASVVHENVVAIHAVADGGALPYFVMPYLRGASLQKRLDSDGPLGVAEILRVSIQIAAGLSAAHAQGLVHRDIKPANILLEDGVERLKITDFGLARAADDASLTRTGVIAGTPQFMSPEQARGELVDSRSDLFSLGSVMYAMCTARPPFRSETSYGTLQRICDAQPRPIREINAGIPRWLVAIIGRLHAKSADDRFQTAHETAQLLEQCLAHVRQPDVAPLPAEFAGILRVPSPASRATSWLSKAAARGAWLRHWPTDRRADWHSERSQSQRRAVSHVFTRRSGWILAYGAILVLICGISLFGRWWFGGQSASAPALKETERPAAIAGEITNTTDTQRTEFSTDVQHSEASDIDREIQLLRGDVDQLEARMSELERQPPNTPSTKEVTP